MAIPLHLGVHLLGLAVAAGLVVLAVVRPRGSSPAIVRPARLGVTLGGSLLAVSHLVVGGLAAPADGWPLVLRAAGYAALAVGAAGGVGGGFAVVALLPPLAPLAAALAGTAAAVATARGVLGRGRQILPLVVGIGSWAVADLLVNRPGLSAGLSIAGSLTAGAWVSQQAARRSLAGRTSVANLVVLLALVVGLGSASGTVLAGDVRAEQVDRLAAVADAQVLDLVDRAGASLEATASALAGATIVTPLEEGDTAAAAAAASRITALPDIDLVVLTDAEGSVVGATAREEELAAGSGLAIAGSNPVGTALEGEVARGVVDLGDGNLAVVGAVPVAPLGEDGTRLALRQVGSLVIGQLLTAPAVVERVATDTAGDAAIVVGGAVVASTFAPEVDGEVAAAATGADGLTELAGAQRVVATSDLGEPARGQLVLALAPSAVAEAGDTALRTTFLLAAVGLLVAGVVATVLARRIVEPVSRLTEAAERVTAGDLGTRVAVERDDEVGRLGDAFDGMTSALEMRDHELRSSLATQETLRDRLEAVTASMGEALLATDDEGLVTTANPAAGVLLGGGAARLVGRPLSEVLRGRAEGGTSLADAVVGPDLGAATVDVRGELTGSRRIVEATAGPLRSEDDRAGRVVVLRDITERVLADRVRTEVIANLSHELNTPLTPIKAFLEVLAARGGLDDRYLPMLDLAREGRTRLERTITALVDLAELEAGKKQVELAAVPVERVVRSTVDRWRPQLDDRDLVRRVARGTPPVWTDATTVGRILDELLDNASKFGEGTVRLLAEADGDEVRLTVRDDGPGIDPDRRAEVLELFTQADGSSTRAVGGLGIGLPIASRLADLIGGRLELGAGQRRGGLDVTLILPVAEEVGP